MSGKRENKSASKKPIVLLVSLVLVVTAVLGVTIAYLTAQTNQVKNTFTPGEVSCKVEESFNGSTKSNVFVQNTGDTDAYIRAAIVVTWQDNDGKVYVKQPVKGKDYSMTLSLDNWTEKGGYYYYKGPVAAKTGGTEPLIVSCAQSEGANVPDGYTLHVEILAQAIQSSPDDAVKEAWGDAAADLVKDSEGGVNG